MKKHLSFHSLIILSLFTFFLLPFTLSAQADSLDVKIRAGYNIGGTAPLPMPASIRSIDAFRLTPSFLVGGDVILPLGDRFGLSAGLHLENKGMDADVTVKSYSMEMTKGNSQISGLFTGHVSQQVTQWMLTVPVSFMFQVSNCTFKFGPYFSLLIKKEFSGIASDGYLRQGAPTGPRIEIGNKEAGTSAATWASRPTSTGVSPASSIAISRPSSRRSIPSTDVSACSITFNTPQKERGPAAMPRGPFSFIYYLKYSTPDSKMRWSSRKSIFWALHSVRRSL